jgi:hypothetical protein
MRGEDVKLLHSELRLLGYEIPDAELEEAFFGRGTHRVVVRFQEEHRLEATGEVDERTAARINTEVDALTSERAEFVVSGHVRNADTPPTPIAGLMVRAYDRNFQSDDLLLGEMLTDTDGLFKIRYAAEQFRQFEKPRADLVVSVFNAHEEPLQTSDVRFRAEAVETVDFVIDREEYRGPSEYEQHMLELRRYLHDDLTEEDIDYVVGRTGIDRQHVAWLVQALKLARETQLATDIAVPAEAFYGWFRLDLPTDLGALWALPTDTLLTTLKMAIERRIAPSDIGASLDEISARIEQIKLDSVLHAPALGTMTSLHDLLTILPQPLNLGQEQVLAATVADLRPEDPQLVNRIADLPGFDGDAVGVARTLRLGALTNGHLPLMEALQSRLQNGNEQDATLRPLASLRPDEWINLAYAHGVSEPVVSAEALSANIERLHPTATLAAHMADGRRLAHQPALVDVGTFLRDNPNFDIVMSNLNTLTEGQLGSIEVSKHERLVDGLRSLRLMQVLGARWDETATLMENNLGSPPQLLAAGPAQLTTLLDGQLAPERVRELYQQAEDLHDVTLAAYTAVFSPLSAPNVLPGYVLPDGIDGPDLENPDNLLGLEPLDMAGIIDRVAGTMGIVPRLPPPGAVDAPVTTTRRPLTYTGRRAIANEPTLQALFGAQEACACEHCSSVLSPAAYFVDLLQFINKAGLWEGLLKRRPDLVDIELSCNNTNTEVPAIDLALEILENAVALPFDVLLDAGTDIIGELNGLTIGESLKAALGETVRKLSDDLWAKPEGADWTVVDGHRRWKLTAQPQAALMMWTDMLDIKDLDLPALIADLDQGNDTLLADTNFDQLIAPNQSQPPGLITNYDVTITRLVKGQSWRVEYQFIVEVRTVIDPPKLVLQTDKGMVWYETEEYDEATILAINDELSSGSVPRLVGLRLADRFNTSLSQTVIQAGADTWIIKSDKDEQPLRFLPASLKITSLTYQSGDPKADAVAEPENHNPRAYYQLKERTFPWSLPLDLPLEAVRLYLERARSSRGQLIESMMPINQKARENPLFAREVLGLSEAEADVIAPESLPSDDQICEHWGISPTATSIVDAATARIVTGASPLVLLKHVSILLQQSRLSFEELQALIKTGFVLSAGTLPIEPPGSCKPSEMMLNTLTTGHLDRIHRFVRLQRRLGWSTLELDTAIKTTTGANLNTDTLLQLANLMRLHELLDLPVSTILAWWNDPVDNTSRISQLARALDTTKAELDHTVALFGIIDPFADPGDALRFCERAMQFRLSGISFEDARYLLTHHDTLGSNVTLTDKLLTQLMDAARDAVQSSIDVPETLSLSAATISERVEIEIGIRHACEDAIITSLATGLGAERELVDDLLRTRLRHPSNPSNAAIDVFLGSDGDFMHLWSLIGKLVTQSDPVSGHLWKRFSAKNQQALIKSTSTAPQQQSTLVSALNRVLEGASIYAARGFAGVALSAETVSLIQQNPTGTDLMRLNRLLLEDAYPSEIVKHRGRDTSFNIGDVSEPDSGAVRSVLMRLYKTVFICDALKLNRANLTLLRMSPADKNGFTTFDFNMLPVPLDTVPASVSPPANVDAFAQLLALAQLRDSAPGAADLLHQYAALNFDDAGSVDVAHTLLAAGFAFDDSEVKAAAAQLGITSAEEHRNPINLSRLIKLLAALKQLGATVDETRNQTDDPGHPIPVPSNVPNGLTAPSPTDRDASNARTLLRSKYGESNWHKLIKPIADNLRERQRDALVDYLIAEDQKNMDGRVIHSKEGLIYNRLRDSNDLYEYYLIDFQTGSCLKTTRLLQATAAVQLFVQRVLLNLEKGSLLAPDKRALWKDWMGSYRVWEANRKVFLFPENWLLPELRDDKTAIFRQMESALGEQEPSTENTRAALLVYLDDLGDLAQISVIAMYEDLQNTGEEDKPVWKKTLYVVGRTPNTPFRYFWRSCTEFGSEKMSWTGWEALELDNANDFIMPFVFEGDLHVAWPIFRETVDQEKNDKDKLGDKLMWEVQIAWMRRTTKGWVKRKIGKTQLDVKRLLNKDEAGSFAFRLSKKYNPVTIPGSKPLLREEVLIYCYAADEVEMIPAFTGNLMNVGAKPAPDSTPAPGLKNVNLSLSGSAFLEYKVAGVTKYERAPKDMVVTLFYGFHYAAPSTYVEPKVVVQKIDENGYFDFGKLEVVNEGIVQLHVFWPNFPPSILKATLKDDDGDEWLNWTWNLTVGVTDASVAAHYRRDRPVKYDPAGSFIFESGRDIHNGGNSHTKQSLDQLAGTYVNVNRFVSSSGITLSADGLWSPDHVPEFPLTITRATQPPAPTQGLSSPPPTLTRIWYLQDKNSGFFLQKDKGVWRVWPDGQPFASSYRGTAALSTNALFHPAIQKVLHYYDEANTFDRDAAYANYNWEVFLHLPLAITDYLASQQRFEDARRWLHTIFDPTTDDKNVKTGILQFWRFLPFIEDSHPDSIAQMLTWLADTDPKATDPDFKPTREFTTFEQKFASQIREWQDNPFMPHVIARLRPSAYQWHTFFAYLDVLIGWGDQLFRRDTRESVNAATLLYILAARLLGPRPRIIPASTPPASQTYRSLSNNLDDFSNAWGKYAELPGFRKLFKLSQQSKTMQSQQSRASMLSGANGMGIGIPFDKSTSVPKTGGLTSLGALAFCIPQNEKVTEYYDRVEDRLFNVRNCRNIEGVFRDLPLYEPPIDPLLLIRARAAGLDIYDVLNEMYAPLPNYRFSFTLQKALELCAELKSLGGALLAALEKKDAEELTLLRSSHEVAMLTLVRDIRKQQIDEAEANITALQQSKDTILVRFGQYQKLLGKTSIAKGQDGLPVVEQSSSLTVSTDSGGGVSGLGLSSSEVAQLVLTAAAHVQTQAANSGHIMAGLVSLLPNIWAGGVFAGQTFGGVNLGIAATAIAKSIEMGAAETNYLAGLIGTFAGYERRQDEWVHQSKLAVGEMQQIDKQIIAAQIRKDIAQRESDNHDTQIENAQSVDEFMRGKFTNQQLYRWMSSQIAGVYFRTYQLALDQARRTERAYQHELGLDKAASFVQPGSWDTLKKGLLAGDHLHHALKRMESAYLERNVREFEITKNISLLQLNPVALLALKENGSCSFDISEELFDLDYPGHYMRRIKMVSLSIPCVVGPYASVSATLKLTKNNIRFDPRLDPDYKRNDPSPSDTDSRFMTTPATINAIVTTNAQQDSGMFEPNLRDERYLPFEGAGVISSWTLDLPDKFRQFDYNTISDVILHVRYTARNNDDLREPALDNLEKQIGTAKAAGLVRLFSIRHEFPTEWANFKSAGPGIPLKITLRGAHFPYWTHGLTRTATTSMWIEEMTDKTSGRAILSEEHDLSPSLSGLPSLSADFEDVTINPAEKTADDIWLLLTYSVT